MSRYRTCLENVSFALLVAFAFVAVAPRSSATGTHAQTDKTEEILSRRIDKFYNDGEPLLPTLLRIAAENGLPMGIERVTIDSIQKPIEIRWGNGTLRSLIDVCVSHAPDYGWGVRDGTVHVYGVEEWNQSANFFNFIIPLFEIQDESISFADMILVMRLRMLKENRDGIGISRFGSTELEKRRLTLRLTNASVGEILDHLVALHGEAVWIATVPPEELSQAPQGALWTLVPRDMFVKAEFRSTQYLNAFVHLLPQPDYPRKYPGVPRP